MPRKSKWTPEALQQLENDLLERLARGEEAENSHPLMNQPEFAAKLAVRKEQLRSHNQGLSQHVLSSTGMASLAIAGILQQTAAGISQESLQAEIPKLMQQLKSGDDSLLQEALLGQVLTLQALSSNLIAQASVQPDINQKQTLLHLGLKAANQLRQTIATLNEVRNPRRTTFIKRQLNQLRLDSEKPKKLEKSPNELSEGGDNASTTLDDRTEATATRTHSRLAALDAEYRPQDS